VSLGALESRVASRASTPVPRPTRAERARLCHARRESSEHARATPDASPASRGRRESSEPTLRRRAASSQHRHRRRAPSLVACSPPLPHPPPTSLPLVSAHAAALCFRPFLSTTGPSPSPRGASALARPPYCYPAGTRWHQARPATPR
jgi:hypothetical protein